ncbi:MAG: hypothetical protein FWF91_00660 [Coriobacteriia bacterium]|nr:hypothetical protein [Coriobacteriia bacterium]
MIYLVFLAYLLITVLVEGAAIFLLFRRREYVYYSLLANLLTNPALNLLLLLSVNLFGEGAYYLTLTLAELATVFIEAAVYRYLCDFKFPKSLALSVFLNLLSLAAGLILNHFIA